MRAPALFFLITLLLGCSTTAVRLTEAERQTVWQKQLRLLEANPQWSLSGRVAIKTDDQGWQASLRWTNAGQDQRIQLIGPFGGGVVLLRLHPDGAVLKDNRGEEYSDGDAEYLLQQFTGWRLPVTGLQYWVRGRAIPGQKASVELNKQGLLKRLRQNDWDIRYLAYTPHGFMQLPRRIFMSRSMNDGSGQTLEIRLALNSWQSAP